MPYRLRNQNPASCYYRHLLDTKLRSGTLKYKIVHMFINLNYDRNFIGAKTLIKNNNFLDLMKKIELPYK